MRGTGPVKIGKDVVFAYFPATEQTARVRMSADEGDRLDLFPGRQVRVSWDGREAVSALLTAVVPAPPFIWIEMEFADMTSRTG